MLSHLCASITTVSALLLSISREENADFGEKLISPAVLLKTTILGVRVKEFFRRDLCKSDRGRMRSEGSIKWREAEMACLYVDLQE